MTESVGRGYHAASVGVSAFGPSEGTISVSISSTSGTADRRYFAATVVLQATFEAGVKCLRDVWKACVYRSLTTSQQAKASASSEASPLANPNQRHMEAEAVEMCGLGS